MFQSPSHRGTYSDLLNISGSITVSGFSFQSPSHRGTYSDSIHCLGLACLPFYVSIPFSSGNLLGPGMHFSMLRLSLSFQSPSHRGTYSDPSLNYPNGLNQIEYTLLSVTKATLFFRFPHLRLRAENPA